jgi:DNA-binding FadR family transcriptional regulator
MIVTKTLNLGGDVVNNYKRLLDPIGNESIVEAIINRITNSIIAGELKKGSKIPTEAEFSKHLNVGRNSVREAIKVLVYLGVLEIRLPGGTYVADGFSDKMLNPLLYSLILEDSDSKYLIDLRNMFEVSIINLAIRDATEEDIEKIQKNCDNLISILESETDNYEAISDADINFHRAIGEATHNPLIKRLYSVITMLTLPSRLRTIERIITSGNYKFLVNSHKNIFEIIRDRNTKRVAEEVDYSYLFWKDNV